MAWRVHRDKGCAGDGDLVVVFQGDVARVRGRVRLGGDELVDAGRRLSECFDLVDAANVVLIEERVVGGKSRSGVSV